MGVPHSTSVVDEELLKVFRHLHAHPELSMAEHRTSEYLQSEFAGLGFEIRRYGSTGFVAELRNGLGPVVAFRADMDGLPVLEDTGLKYASTVTVPSSSGGTVPVMHACGHDIHMTVALGLAKYMVQHQETWTGTLLLILQPGEETGEGAAEMVEAGLWKTSPIPECLLGLHVWGIPAGTVELVSGDTMAMGDSFEVTVIGVGGHGSQPQNSIDPILIASSIVTTLQSIVARNIGPLDAGVVTVGTFHAGTKENIIPAEAKLTLNIRSFDPAVRDEMLEAVRRIADGVARAYGAPPPEFRRINEFPRLYSDPELVERLRSEFADELPEGSVSTGSQRLASEDFGLLAQSIDIPCAFWFIGGYDPATFSAENAPQNHSPQFAPDPLPTLEIGVASAVAACHSVLTPTRTTD